MLLGENIARRFQFVRIFRKWRLRESEHALLRADPCFIRAQRCLIVTSYSLDVSSAYVVMDNDVTEAFKRCL